ncbi:LysR family transcriptional regulator [Bradyrhizobium sp. LHD-71]|uniref:LysR family transcriptional regulator n=1 Tax=Bradyrhizobium sp. LHD-71 TaxID=3072141 RepID=UPI00280CB7D7|nr:LysR family transcriptional regulator [Bradyrhizobium sp. LHD-71]MDQ8727845.1 LysR family transcriptional regulator [Bradyrhizobium sp. LHD-71]
MRHLRYFVAAAEDLNLTRAAARLRIAQPALTLQIRALEAEIGAELFSRHSRGVDLTEAGRIFLAEARRILEAVPKAAARARQASAGSIGRVSVGLTESASFNALVTNVLRKFRATYPNVEMSLEEARSTELVEALEHGRIDAAFVRLPVSLKHGFALQTLLKEPMVAAVPADHPLADRRQLRLQDLRHEDFILYPRATRLGLSDSVMTACADCGFTPSVVQTAPQISSTINLVASSMGISIVPACMQNSRADAVRYIPLSGTQIWATLCIAYRTYEGAPPLANLVAMATQPGLAERGRGGGRRRST